MNTYELFQETYGQILETALIEEIANVATLMPFDEGDILIDIGQYIKTMPLLINGAIKVMREDFDEGELLLYFLERGDTCSMTMTCCMGDKRSEIRAVAETKGLIAMIPISKMEEWMGKYKSWREFVMESYHRRFNEMLFAIDQIAFMKMDERLYRHLREKSNILGTNNITQTHQEIAQELNSSRVVISRLLKALENEGLVKLNRNNIEILK